MSVVIETTLGDLTVDLFVEERPLSCLNFMKLCKMKYYNLCLFHSVNANFCAQTGDPTGKGDGGESIHGLIKGSDFRFYQGEVQPKLKHDKLGLVSMASHGDGMFGSQFIITLSSNLGSLDGEHCVFGQIVEGSEVLLKLNEAITDDQHRPYQDIRITHTVVLEDPFPDPPGMGNPPPSPLPPSIKDVAFSRIPADEPLKDACTQEELDEMVQAREAAARATILEMVGDLPDADVAPPENVLFVCKLNPVTSDHDLSIIFSRFGKVKSCEVIRDNVTGDSLQYAFVEFEDQKSCEEAYFKMDNVLIDDRRIHVDFSQSVAKWRGKGKGVELLVPPPPGGWGNRNWNKNRNRRQQPINRKENVLPERRKNNKTDGKEERIKNGVVKQDSERNTLSQKKHIKKKKRRPSTSPSSSESTETTSSSESEPTRRKNRRRTEKVVLVVKTPRSKKTKKKRVQSRSNKYNDSDSSDSERLKKKKKKQSYSSSVDSSSDESIKSKKRKKKKISVEEKRKRTKKRKRNQSEYSSDDSSIIQIKKKSLKKKRKRKSSDSSDEEPTKSKRRKLKTSKKRQQYDSSDDTSSCD